MAQKSEQAKVGAIVALAGVLFLSALIFVGGFGLFQKKKAVYTTYFKFAGGLEPGSLVRFGGLKVGTVEGAQIDPEDSTRIRIRLRLVPGTPVRANSRARISTLGFLGDNYVEISPGTAGAPLLPSGSTIRAEEIVQLADVFNNVNNVTVGANRLVGDLNQKFDLLADNANQLIGNLNAMTGPENRARFNSVLANADGMLAEARPHLKATLANLDTASSKLTPAIDKASVTLDRANILADNLNKLVIDNRVELHRSLVSLDTSLSDAQRLILDLDDTIEGDRPNLDETLENARATSENLRQFTDTIKRRPYSLVRVKEHKDRVPPFGK